MSLELKSSAFVNGGDIPKKYGCYFENVSPPISWNGAPEKTVSFALIIDDPDAPAGDWVHWVVWNIPPSTTTFREGMDKAPSLAGGIKQGVNDFGKTGWDGPGPPSGTHRYYFKLYALDKTLELPQKARKADVLAAIKGHILAETNIMGKFSK